MKKYFSFLLFKVLYNHTYFLNNIPVTNFIKYRFIYLLQRKLVNIFSILKDFTFYAKYKMFNFLNLLDNEWDILSLNLFLLASCQNLFLITGSHTRVCDQRCIRFAMLELVFTGTAGSSWSELFLTIPTVRAAPSPFLLALLFFLRSLSCTISRHFSFITNKNRSTTPFDRIEDEGSFLEHLSISLFFSSSVFL